MSSSTAEDPGETESVDGTSSPSVDRNAARAALAQLHFEADFARRAAITARLTAERARLAGFTRVRHRP